MLIPGQLKDFTNFTRRIPEGDDHERVVCETCDFVYYENPKMIAGAVVESAGKILMCRRAIAPQLGLWTLPAGFMEMGESPAEGAVRETWEEARAKITIKDMLAIYSVRRIGQVHMYFRATLNGNDFAPGPESTDVCLMDLKEIPWDEIAFPTVYWALKDFERAKGQDRIAPFTNPEKYKDL